MSAEEIEKNDNQAARKLRNAGRKVAAHRMGDSGLKCERLPGKNFSEEGTPWRIKLQGDEDHCVTCEVKFFPQKSGPGLFITAENIIWSYKHDKPQKSLRGGFFPTVRHNDNPQKSLRGGNLTIA